MERPGFNEDTYQAVLRYHQAWKSRKLDAILALYHPDIAYHDHLQNRVFRHDGLRDYVQASLPASPGDRLEHCDRIRVDGDTAFIQYQLSLDDGRVLFHSSEAIRVKDGLVWRIDEYATLQRAATAAGGTAGRSPLQRLGLSARQLGRLAAELHNYFQQQRPYLDPACTLQTVAAATGYSRNQLSYLLNQVLGSSFYQYVNAARVRHLLAELPRQPLPLRVDELAFAAGFNSLSSFYRAFRDETGMTPSAYLRQIPCVPAGTTTPPADG
ncbi:nuclear transport factor 2 family protein [Vogesella sp. LIG4]|uniref:AraC family transcriptional regulator n=1 Tax=Vogesella sp. LIG4 TaxID=1192162 RepID=UPI00081FF04D|nr:nuclear transport factor 2 family protein [Vogesella sp. LIG4]SCK21089.1 AraC-type DNA-binding protein [Vogesella sp. LIG4]